MSANPVLAAANRLMHGDYPDDLTEEQRIARLAEDANLVAGDYELMWRDLSDSATLLAAGMAPMFDSQRFEWNRAADAQVQANQRRLGLATPEGAKHAD